MTKQERDKLRELALAATPGEWEMASDLPAYAIYTENGWRVVQTPNQNNRKQWGTSNDTHGIGRFSDAAYIAAANPATVLALLDRVDELEGMTPTDLAVPECTESHLNAVRSVLDQAYNSAVPVCCGRPGHECCGSPEPSWEDDDIAIMDALGPVEKFLSELLAAAPGAGGGE